MAREHIRTLRKLRSLSQSAAAKIAGLTASEFSRIECGYRDMSIAEAGAIAKALQVDVSEIAGALSAAPATPAIPAALVAPAPASAPAPVPAPAPTLTLALVSTPAPALTPAVARQAPKEMPATAAATGGDLNDPANFRELPDFDKLVQGALPPGTFRAQLRQAMERATKILHTSRVPADVWRAWRDFERRAQESLRNPVLVASGEATGSAAPAVPPSIARELGAAPRSATPRINFSETDASRAIRLFRLAGSSKERHAHKSLNALFVQAARKVLPGEVTAKLTSVAEHRLKSNRAAGFMRHFRNAAGEMLLAAEVSKVTAEIRANEAERSKSKRGRR